MTDSSPNAKIHWDGWSELDEVRAMIRSIDHDAWTNGAPALPVAVDDLEWLFQRFESAATEISAPIVRPYLSNALIEIREIKISASAVIALLAQESFTDTELQATTETFRAAVTEFATTVGALPDPEPSCTTTTAKDEIQRIRQSASSRIRSVQNDVEAIRKRLDTKHAEAIKSIDGAIESLNETVEERASAASERAKGIDESLTKLRDELATLRANVSSFESTLDEKSTDAIEKAKTGFKNAGIKRSQDWKKFLDEAKLDLDDVSNRSKELLEDAGKTLNATASASHSMQYSKTARNEGLTAVAYQSVGTLAIAWAVVIVSRLVSDPATVLADESGNQLSGEIIAAVTAARIAISTLLTGVSIYFFKQANRHRGAQSMAKERALIMATHQPFISTLDDNVEKDITEKMARGPLFKVSGAITEDDAEPTFAAPSEAATTG